MAGFEKDSYSLDKWRLARLDKRQAEELAALIEKTDPWKTLGSTRENLAPFFVKRDADVTSWGIFLDNTVAGVISIKPSWLLGPYLGLIAILPQYQRAGLGLKILNWMEEEGRQSRARNLFLCVSGFNLEAQAFYCKSGFEKVASLDGLIVDDHAEILMRKRLQY